MKLLIEKQVNEIVLNDADYHIYAFWSSVLHDIELFTSKLYECPVTVEEWHKQRHIYANPSEFSRLEVGFSTFFLNRTNKGGILPSAGPIGGYEQLGTYKLDVRFNKSNLLPRLKEISNYRDKIQVYNLDAAEFIKTIVSRLDVDRTLTYLDPPYYVQGRNLYLNYYEDSDHANVEETLREASDSYWIVSYDNVEPIGHLYRNYRRFEFNINYSVQTTYRGKELMIFSEKLILPKEFTLSKNTVPLIILDNECSE